MTALLVFTGAVGYRHDSIEAGARAVEQLAREAGVEVVISDDARVFETSTLNGVDGVVWMQTSGTGNLNDDQRAAYEDFTARGGGFAGVHAASDAERDWPLFSRLVGARFRSHPATLQSSPLVIESPSDPSARPVASPWEWTDEWYAFDANPRDHVQVIISIAEATYDPGDAAMGEDHPITWRAEVGRAKAWYTALGHSPEMFDDPAFRAHLWGGISSILATHD